MDSLDRIYREKIGDDASDRLIAGRVHLDLLFTDKVQGHMAFGKAGGYNGRTITGSGKTPQEAALGLLNGSAAYYRPVSLQSSLWALGEAVELLAGAMSRD